MFRFKQFTISQDQCAMKVGTDGVLLGAWAAGGRRILDVGTGTGLIALMMAQRFGSAEVTAIDIDPAAVAQARANVAASPFAGRVGVELAAVQSHEGTYDAIVSNPPYFSGGMTAPDARRTMARHTATMDYGALMDAARRMLATDGELSVVVPFDYRRRMEDEAIFCGFFERRVCAVTTVEGKTPRRYLLSFRRHPCTLQSETLLIGSAAYERLTDAFYL